jgi:hypothetical protein
MDGTFRWLRRGVVALGEPFRPRALGERPGEFGGEGIPEAGMVNIAIGDDCGR